MNGRMYDANLGRFLSPDNYIQDPFNTQSYNRYGYVWNNPLSYMDPSGEFFITAMIIGAIIGGYIGGAKANGGELNPTKWEANWNTVGGVLAGAAVGATAGGSVANIFMGAAVIGGTGTSLVAIETAKFGVGHLIGASAFAAASLHDTDFKWTSDPPGSSTGDRENGIRPWDTNNDHILQKSEADNWWLIGGGTEIWVDNSYINWSGLEYPPNTGLFDEFAIQTHTAFLNLPWETVSTYGGTRFTRISPTDVMVHDQEYHYDYRSNNSLKNVGRNIMNWYGKPRLPWPNNARAIEGQDFKIHYNNRLFKLK